MKTNKQTLVVEFEFDWCDECNQFHRLGSSAAEVVRAHFEKLMDSEKERITEVYVIDNSDVAN